MRTNRNDPTANAAIGAVDRELKRMRREAERLRALRRRGHLTPAQEERVRARYTGIFRHIWTEVMES